MAANDIIAGHVNILSMLETRPKIIIPFLIE